MLTSTANPRVKQIRKLRERKERQQSGLYYLEGLRLVAEAVRQPAALELLIIAPDLLTSSFGMELAAEAHRQGVEVLEVSRQVFEWFSLKDGPQGIAAVARQDWTDLAEVSMEAGAVWVTLDAVQDPGNLGTILRTLDAIGGQGVILLENSADPYDPTAIRASMGAIFSQRLVRTTYAQLALWKKETGIALIGASGAGTEDYHQIFYPPSLALLMGSERQGLKPQHLQLCDHIVRIPMMGTCDSLNLAVATAIVLYEIFNQHRGSGQPLPGSGQGGKGEKQ